MMDDKYREIAPHLPVQGGGMEHPDPEVFAQGLVRGFSRLWLVGQRYEIHNGRLYEFDPGVRAIAPAGSPQLVNELARLYEGDEDAVLGFASTWGLLGWWPMTRDAVTPGSERYHEIALASRLSAEDPRIGEPLSWIWAHASGVRLCLTLLGYLRARDVAGLQEHLASLRLPVLADAGPDDRYPVITCGMRHAVQARVLVMREDDPVGWASLLIRAVVNANLREGITEQLEEETVAGQLTLRRRRIFSSLSDVIYWHLAELAQSDDRLAQCEFCGTVFLQEDRRQRFCPPPQWVNEEGHKRGPTESLCAKRARMRRLRRAGKREAGARGGTV
jgi:hypothetical protein